MATPANPREQGFYDYFCWTELSGNPYPEGSKDSLDWQRGWHEADGNPDFPLDKSELVC